MYGNVLAWFDQAGAALLGIKLLNTLVKQVTTAVTDLDAQAGPQVAPTVGVTRTRTGVKNEAAEKAEVLRGLVLTTDDVLAAAPWPSRWAAPCAARMRRSRRAPKN